MRCLFSLVLFVSHGFVDVSACTSYAIGRKATKDGSVIIGQSEDGDDLADVRVVYVPAADHPEGATAPVYYTDGPFPRWVSNDLGPDYKPNPLTGPNVTDPIGFIPQVRHTFAYHDSNFGIINEHNVAIDESTCSAMFYTCAKGDTRHCEPGRTSGTAIMDIRMLSMFAMERATTAREAVKIIGDLAYEYGFYGTHDPNGDGESLMIGDPKEAWVFHILADPTGTKAIWAAKRVPDDGMTVVANMFTIRDVDVRDEENCMASPNLYSVAEEYGWWRPGEVLDFTRVYSNGEYGSKFYSGRRMWRSLSLAAPSLNLSPDYNDLRYDRAWPWYVKPDEPLDVRALMGWYRDWYAGTKFDLTRGLAAGYGGTPDRFDTGSEVAGAWERSIAIYRANIVKIQHLQETTPTRPREIAGVAWVANGPGHYTPFVPLPSGLGQSLAPLRDASPFRPSKSAMNWEARKVMMIAQIRFDHMHPMVARKQLEVEDAGAAVLAEASSELVKTGDREAFARRFVDHCEHVLQTWRTLGDAMLAAFSDNSDIRKISESRHGVATDENLASLSYPSWWLKNVGYSDGPPLPPSELSCPPKCDGASASKASAFSALNGRSGRTVIQIAAFAFFVLLSATIASKVSRRTLRDDALGYGRF